jgi:hypothetical protein
MCKTEVVAGIGGGCCSLQLVSRPICDIPLEKQKNMMNLSNVVEIYRPTAHVQHGENYFCVVLYFVWCRFG